MPSKEPLPIAVIGMGCRFPGGANSPEELWSLVAEGRHAWTEVPADRFRWSSFYHPDANARGNSNQKGGHFLDQDIAAFDAAFFGISPKEAEVMDPQQRVILEVSWEAIENAGIPMDKFKGSDTAVFVAMFGHDFEHMVTKDALAFTSYSNTGTARTLLANRVSYVFDLHGPSVMLDTGCSGSLVAVNSACQSLRAGETDMALAGGVGLIFSPDQLSMMSPTGIFNPEGRCFAFDDRGHGYGRGEGVGMVTLKRLEDAIRCGDNIRAIIRSSGANQDGKTNGITLPNSYAQERLARKLFRDLKFAPSEVHYVEAHGTGTVAGDLAETRAIREVFCTGRDEATPLFMGTAKPNLGHSEAASGSAGLIKTILAMEKGFVPPNILLEDYKPGLNLEGIKIARYLEPWPSTTSTRKAVVNSFGSGGTNAMVVLESTVNAYNGSKCGVQYHADVDHRYRPTLINGYAPLIVDVFKDESPHLFTLSARSEYSLRQGIQDFSRYLQQHENANLDDLSYTFTNRRSNFQWRSTIISHDVAALRHSLETEECEPVKALAQVSNVLVFSGQGAQYARMGYELLSTETEFSKSIQLSDQYLRDLGASWSLVDELCKEEISSRLNDSRFGQPASTAIQIGLVDLLKSWNIHPAAVIGHSSGEIAAAYAAGAIKHSTAIRTAYERSFLAEASRERSSQRGAMMAVGLGAEEVEEYIDGLSSSGVVVACINSPSSTTVSGDALVIAELQKLLQFKGTLARLLKVDTAYHSHHMKLVSDEYHGRLSGLECSPTSSNVRFFSTVTGTEKSNHFGASYWVENLVSPVNFSTALQRLAKQMGQIPLNFIEIGPHKVLVGPIRQSLADLQAEGLSFRYVPTLVRGEDSCKALMNTAANLYKTGSDVYIDLVASIGITSSLPLTISDLPSYHWDHTANHWKEPRLSKEYRFRRHPHHDLLGLRTSTSPDNEPSWRIILTLDSLPWLKDHVIDNFVVFPGSGYCAMAIEAIKQLNQDQHPNLVPKSYNLKNVSFKRTLSLSDDANGVEVILALRHSDTSGYNFIVSSVSGQGKWQEHCDGYISTTFELAFDEVEQSRELDLRLESHLSNLKIARECCVQLVNRREMYARLAGVGNKYGPSFAVVQNARLAESKSLSIVVIPDVAATMPNRFMQPHVIHPTSFDALLHSCVLMFHQRSCRGSVMPVFISDVQISADIGNQLGQKLEVLCDLTNTFASSSNFNVVAYQYDGHAGNDQPRPVMTISNGEVRIVGESQTTLRSGSDNIFKMQWGLDRSSITADALESIVISLQSDEVGILPSEKVAALNNACIHFIKWTIDEVTLRGLEIQSDYRASLFSWMKSLIESPSDKENLEAGCFSKEAMMKKLSNLGLEGELVAKMGPQLTSILAGEADPLALLLENDLLYRVYTSDETSRCNRYLAEYTKQFAFQKSDLRILEVGAGTGGATLQLFQQCSPTGEMFASEYAFTDISSGFFETAQTTSLKKWAHMMTFKTLDLEKDPISQGFDEHGYDLILASNVVHATRSLSQSLENIHRLLKPGGVIGLVEVVKTAPFHSMTFGLLPGWWAGVEDGRVSSPLQSVDQWNQQFINASFSGVELAAYDFPEPARHCAFFTSTSIPVLERNSNSHHPPRMEVLNGLLDGCQDAINCQTLCESLEKKGFKASIRKWSDEGVDDLCAYIIVESADSPLLTHISSQKFKHLTSLLTKGSKLYWITFADGVVGTVPDHAITVGLSRTARSEIEHLLFFTLDVQDGIRKHRDEVLEAVLNFIISTEAKISAGQTLEFEYMLKDRQLHIQRFVPDPKLIKVVSSDSEEAEVEDCPFYQSDRALMAHVDKPGLLSSLIFIDLDMKPLANDMVEVQPFAWGVNFKDVFIALGQMKSTQTMVGECSGIITRVGSDLASRFSVGDRVVVMVGTPYSSKSQVNGHFVHKIPDSMPFADAASIPVAFATAYYGLVDCANLQRGQTVLIHAASGGLGQAAVMIAQHIGAVIFATVGSTMKRQLLTDKYGIPANHVFSSRTLDFQAGIMRLTANEGVDVALNSLSGDALDATWRCVAKMGSFVEVGKTDIYRRNKLSMEPFDRNVQFVSVDLIILSQSRPKSAQDLLQRIFKHFESGDFSTLPVITLPIAEIEQAFRLIQARKHTGKIVLEADNTSVVKAKVRPLSLCSDGTYIIVGGLGSLGRELCRHLQARGARHVALLSKRDFSDESRRLMEEELAEGNDSVVKIVTCDILIASQVSSVAASLKESFPPIRGVLHAAMILADRTLSQMSLQDFQAALQPKYNGTKHVADAFTGDRLDFFIMLSSVASIIGLRGQANYSAGNAFQDMFVHSQVARGLNFVSLNLPLLKDSDAMSLERMGFVTRQGCETVSMKSVLSLIDYAMGRACKEKCHQIAFGVSAQSMLDRSVNGVRMPPLLGHIFAKGQRLARNVLQNVERTVEESIAHALSVAEAQILILNAIKEKVSSLTAADSQELSLNCPVTDLGLDSLVAIELKNWIVKTLQAVVQTSEIMDSRSLKSLATLVSQKSALVKKDSQKAAKAEIPVGESTFNGINTVSGHGTVTKVFEEAVELPKYPLHSLETTMQVFMESVGHLGNETELKATQDAVADLLRPNGTGRRLHARLETLANDLETDNWLIDIYNRALWLSARDMGPRGHNFFGTHALSKLPHTQAERAALVSLAAFEYKLGLDAGTVPRDYRNEEPLCMETVHWLFNSNRVPVLGCDRVDRWPDNDYLVAMRYGHVYKIPLKGQDGEIISHAMLKAIFQAILQLTTKEINWVSILTTGNRDFWAKLRDEIMAVSPINEEFLSCIEKSLFAVCLDDGSPTTGNDRGSHFLLDDNSNRWLDKTVSFIICENGVSATWCQHAMIDGSTPNGMSQAISAAIVNHVGSVEESLYIATGLGLHSYSYIPFIETPEITAQINNLRKQHLLSIKSYSFRVYEHLAYGSTYIRSHKLPPKTVFQLVLQIAVRRHFGYNPSSWDMVVQRQFKRGRFDSLNVQTAEVSAFCAAAEDPTIDSTTRLNLFLSAVKSHTRFVTLSTRGRGWMRHVMALKEVLESGEGLPALYNDPVYLRTRERKVFTSFGDSGAVELGNCWADREALWLSCEVGSESARFFVVNGEMRAEEFVGHIKGAAGVIMGIINSLR